ncbi:MAG: hypothetical protein IPO92_14045 [Saprospiraceae bacterium]|nr:hypothetical protein [Saprospiraceae bacterium]
MSKQALITNIHIIPTSIEGQEILFIDNPDQLAYQIRIYDAGKNIRFQHRLQVQKYGLATRFWTRGKYEVEITLDDGHYWTEQIFLH